MNVKQLIELLQHQDPDAMVVVCGYEAGVDEVNSVEKVFIDLNVNDKWYYGKHEVDNLNGKVGAVLLDK